MSKKNLFLLIAVTSLTVFACPNYAMAEGGTISTGGTEPVVEGCTGNDFGINQSNNVVYGGGTSTFNCCNLKHERCSRWIKLSTSAFAAAYNAAKGNTARYGSYNNADAQACISSDGNMIMAGMLNDYKRSGVHNTMQLVLYNNTSTNAKGNRSSSYSFNYNSGQFENIWDDAAYTNSKGVVVTFNQLLNKLEDEKGISSDTSVAFFCPAMSDDYKEKCTEHGGDRNGDGKCDCNDDNSCPCTEHGGDRNGDGKCDCHDDNTCPPETICSKHIPGSGYPGDKFSGKTSTYSSITSNVFLGENTTIYAKPGDMVYWNHCYYPGAQPVMKSTGSHEEPKPTRSPAINESRIVMPTEHTTIGEQDTFISTSNNFTVSTNNSGYLGATPKITLSNSAFSPTMATGSSVSFSHTRGDSAWTGADSNTMEIRPQGAGYTVTQSINTQTGTNSVSGHSTWSWSWTYTYTQEHNGPSCLHCGISTVMVGEIPVPVCNSCYYTTTEIGYGSGSGQHHNSYSNNNWYKVTSTTSSGGTSAKVNIPYNYTNSGDVQFGSDIIYAGEQFSTSEATAFVDQIYNETTKGTYATKTPQVTAKLYIFYAPNYLGAGGEQASSSSHGDCNYYSSAGYSGCVIANTEYSTLNNGYDMNGSSNDTFFENQTYNVYDLPAGYQFCIGISLWPAQSANGGKDMSSSGNGMTYYSTPTCQDVYKKSSFQVWGGSLMTNGRINVPVSVKNNLYNYYGYTLHGSDASIYGSWVEHAVVAGGSSTISGLSSGASGAYTTNTNGTLNANPGGTRDSKLDNYCKRTPLSFANTSCSSNTPSSGVGVNAAILRSVKDNVISTDETINYRASGSTANLTSDYNLSKDGQTRRTYFAKNATGTISTSSVLPVTTTHVIYAENGTININSDLKFTDTKYTSINQVPQYIIYAKNINIACSVKEINAWLLADGGEINTCYNDDSYSARERSTQLRINGPVVAKNIEMGRTYGTAYGKYTEEAGEIFNYTPMTYMWSETGATNTPTLYNTFTKEISPRY